MGTDSPKITTLILLSIIGLLIRSIGAFGEEVGWRGFLTPRLYKLNSFAATDLVYHFIHLTIAIKRSDNKTKLDPEDGRNHHPAIRSFFSDELQFFPVEQVVTTGCIQDLLTPERLFIKSNPVGVKTKNQTFWLPFYSDKFPNGLV